jgi:hypothetical protein
MSKQDNRSSATRDRRRKFLMQGATVITALAVGGVATGYAQQKPPKAEAAYQPTPNGQAACGNCANFLPPDDCRAILGPVAPSGWCRFYRPRS